MKYQTDNENLKAVVSFLERENYIYQDQGSPVLSPAELLASIFSPGPFYYFILNFFNFQLEYVHPTVVDFYGCQPADFTLDYFISRMHPNDAEQMRLKEMAAGEFFYKRLPAHKRLKYKSSYTFRMQGTAGQWKHILHQCTPIQLSHEGRIHHSLSVHTDVTHLNLLPDHRISFIGMGGEPSFYSLSTDPNSVLDPEKEWMLSRRELDIIKFMAEGQGSKQIADYLSISTHTVDTHRRNLLKKTGTKNTLELTVACIKKGLI